MPDQAQSVDFAALILGFSSAALHYMGEAVVEGRKSGQKNLPLAKQNIEIIELLQAKTKGNLSKDEAELIEQLLHDLRVKFVETSK
jgi:hypothetical protein